jgi:signal transduction histidine kinase
VVARSPIPVDLTLDLPERPPAEVESAAYFVVSEALTNVARHAHATRAHVGIVRNRDRLIVEVRDNGTGGADPAAGSGLAGLADRVRALGGTFDLLSPAGGPTTLLVELPCAS